jgi:hypothetical protein
MTTDRTESSFGRTRVPGGRWWRLRIFDQPRRSWDKTKHCVGRSRRMCGTKLPRDWDQRLDAIPSVGENFNRIHLSLDRGGALYGVGRKRCCGAAISFIAFIHRGIRPPSRVRSGVARDHDTPLLIVSPQPSASPNHHQRSLGGPNRDEPPAYNPQSADHDLRFPTADGGHQSLIASLSRLTGV